MRLVLIPCQNLFDRIAGFCLYVVSQPDQREPTPSNKLELLETVGESIIVVLQFLVD